MRSFLIYWAICCFYERRRELLSEKETPTVPFTIIRIGRAFTTADLCCRYINIITMPNLPVWPLHRTSVGVYDFNLLRSTLLPSGLYHVVLVCFLVPLLHNSIQFCDCPSLALMLFGLYVYFLVHVNRIKVQCSILFILFFHFFNNSITTFQLSGK